MVFREDFARQVASAYRHLYDLVSLRGHPLTSVLAPDPSLSRSERALRLHRILLDTIEDLRPSPQASIFSRQARWYRLLELRYVKGLTPQAAARELGVGRRHYYREHQAAVEALAALLWDRYGPDVPPAAQPPRAEEPDLRHLELLRLEAARMARADRSAHLGDVVGRLEALLQDVLQHRELELRLALDEDMGAVSIDANLLRQVLLGLLGCLIEAAQHARIELEARPREQGVELSLRVEPPSAVRPAPAAEAEARLAALAEMAALAGLDLRPLPGAPADTGSPTATVGFDVLLPAAQRTVLAIDDNDDILELFQRYLSPHHYRVVTARSAPEALELARRLQPQAITLDLMMPGQDGWDILQTLLNQASTRHIPVIVCTVLRQKELAISMGASAFLEKPVSEQALLGALAALEGGGGLGRPE